MNIHDFWSAALKQDACALKAFFHPDASIRWHNTNEHFTAEEFIQANCEYPDIWNGQVQRQETAGDLIITATYVYAVNKPLSFHVVSFFQVKEDKILSIDEYWGEDGPAPLWRLDKHIGKPIK